MTIEKSTPHRIFSVWMGLTVLLLMGGAPRAMAERPVVSVALVSGETLRVSREQIDALPQHLVDSSQAGREGRFRGPLVRDFLAWAGVKSSEIEITAFDDYVVQIPRTLWEDYDSIFATVRNDEVMRIRDKGPLWLIFPWDTRPELRDERYYNLSIWQIKMIRELP
ncbi:MAG: hypothetical protein H6999_07555 [Hahellaceae bacterium]|nr:hypothetical protein [Hahellaceae bacterium]